MGNIGENFGVYFVETVGYQRQKGFFRENMGYIGQNPWNKLGVNYGIYYGIY